MTQDPQHQAAATREVLAKSPSPVFQNAIMAIVLHGGRCGVSPHVRQSAGLAMKNNLRKYNPQQRQAVQRLSLMILGDPDKTIRGLASTMVAHIVRTQGLQSWPQLPPLILRNLQPGSSTHLASGTLKAMFRIVEDTGDLIMTFGGDGGGFGDSMTVLLIQYLQHPVADLRVLALKIIIELVHQQPLSFEMHLKEMLTALGRLARDPNVEVQVQVLVAFTNILDVHHYHDVFQSGPTFPHICQHMMQSCAHGDERVVQAAISFWGSICYVEDSGIRRIMFSHFPKLLPFLIRKLEFHPDDPEIGAMDDDWTVPDRCVHAGGRLLSHLPFISSA